MSKNSFSDLERIASTQSINYWYKYGFYYKYDEFQKIKNTKLFKILGL